MNRSWFVYPRPRPAASLRLFCFPYSGAGPHIYYPWLDEFPDEIEIAPVQLPGHGARIYEPPGDDLPTMVLSLCQALVPHLTGPFAFFGHSLGALLCYEVARELRRSGQPLPCRIFAAGRQAPHIPAKFVSVRELGRSEFVEMLRRYQGTPEALLRNQDVFDLFLPVIRADFLLAESYVYREEPPLACAISSFGGLDDEWVEHGDVRAWAQHTTGLFSARLFPGNHFFIHGARSPLIRAVCDDLLPTSNREAANAG